MIEEPHTYDERQAARYIAVSSGTMRSWRTERKGPRYFRAGKLIRYRRADLDLWIEERLSQPDAPSSTGTSAVQAE